MRLLEIGLIVTEIVLLFLPSRQRTAIAIVAALLLILLPLHFVIEQPRWQMTLIYLLAPLLIAWRLFAPASVGRGLAWTAGGLALLMLLLSVGLGILFPIVRLAELPGPYKVGTTTLALIDTERLDPYAPFPNQRRAVMMQLWYPAEEDVAGRRAPYLANGLTVAHAVAARFGLPSFLLNHVRLLQARAIVEAPVVEEETRFPLIFFSHGLGGVRNQNTQQVETLASLGYVVAAVDHSYAAAVTVFPDGRVADYNPDVIAFDTTRETVTAQRLVETWTADLHLALARLKDQDAADDFLLANTIDFERIGVFGHSTGGGTAFQFCYEEPACLAAAGLDPWVVPTADRAVADGIPAPIMAIGTPTLLGPANELRLAALFANQQQPAYWLTVADTGHFDFTDFKRLSPALQWVDMTGSIAADEINGIMNAYLRNFFDYYLKGEGGALLFAEPLDFPQVSLRSEQ